MGRRETREARFRPIQTNSKQPALRQHAGVLLLCGNRDDAAAGMGVAIAIQYSQPSVCVCVQYYIREGRDREKQRRSERKSGLTD